MQVSVTGIGIWSSVGTDWSSFKAGLNGERPEDHQPIPAPELIAKAERRRAPKTAKLAVEVAAQACGMANADPADTASVFTSVLADTEISDQICRALTLPTKMLSPTKFHNSVQNAPAGYWAIGAGNHAPCNYIGGYMNCWALGLVEAATQCIVEQRKLLLVNYDIINTAPLRGIIPISNQFASAILIEPHSAGSGIGLTIDFCRGAAELPKPADNTLQAVAAENPSASVLSQLEQFAASAPQPMHWPVSESQHLTLTCTGSL